MRKLIFFILGLAVVGGGILLWAKELPTPLPHVVAFGDSLTQGVGATESGGFVTLLSRKLGVPIENLGVSGETTSDALKRLPAVLAQKPTVTILLFGGNDFFHKVPEDEIFNNLGQLIEKLQKDGSKVLLVGLESEVPGNDHRARFDALAAKYQTAYVPDVLDGIFGIPSLMSDARHPNQRGYEMMAERIRPVLKTLID
jgi:acyl-CoA thioesterase-1